MVMVLFCFMWVVLEGKGRKKKGKCKGGKEKMCNFAGKRRDMAGKPPCAGVGMVGMVGAIVIM